MAESIVSLIDVEKRFGSNLVVRKMNMEIYEGEFLTLLGPSGCGKTTTLRMIAGFEDATSGIIKVQGERVENKEPYQRDVNTVFQNYALFPHMTVFDNVAYGLTIKKVPKDEIRQRVAEMLELVQLTDYERRKPDELSGGQKQRVAIARALASDPKVLLCDEATSALDPQTTRSILRLIQDINRKTGITVVIITHEMAVVKDVCQRVAVMDGGRVVEMGDVFSIFSTPREAVTRSFIATTSNLSKVEELIEAGSPMVELKPGEMIVRMTYTRKNVSEAIISDISRRFGIDINIIYSNLEVIEDAPLGGLVAILSGDRVQEALEYWTSKNVRAEVLKRG